MLEGVVATRILCVILLLGNLLAAAARPFMASS